MAERSPFPKKETEICKLSCESMAGLRAAALPSIKSNDSGRPSIIMSPASSNLSSSSLLPLIHCTSGLPITPDHQAHSSSILIPNPNPNSIGSPNPSPNFRSKALFTSPHPAPDYHSANFTNSEKISTCRFKKAEQSPNYSSACIASPVMPRYGGACSTSNSVLTERSPRISSAQQQGKDYHSQMKEDDHGVGLTSREDQMISAGGFGLLAAHAYSPWIFEGITSCADEYQELEVGSTIAGMARASRNICEEYTTMGSEQPLLEMDDPDRPFAGDASAAPVSPSSLGDGAAAHSSPSSSASELHDASTATADDTTSTLTPVPGQRGDDPSKDAVPTDNTPPLKKQRRKGQKRVREARVALLTKSEVEHLEDGYRWRKYGQKAVKNSPHPRSYYRCTNSKCFVKKRVERCSEDPSLVVTTYEGQHTHHSPALLRGSIMQQDPNIPISSPNVTFVPWPSSLINPNIYLSSSLAHTELINRSPLSSSNHMLSSFPPTSSSTVSFPALHHLEYCSVQRAQPQLEGAYGHGISSSLMQSNFTPAFDAAHHQQQSSSLLHVRPMAFSTFQTPQLVDRGLLHDMLPHPSTGNASPPSSSMS